MKDLLAIIIEFGIELHPDRISILADKIDSIDSVEHFSQIKSAFGSNIDKNLVVQFESAWKNNRKITPKEVAIALRSASATAVENEKRGKIEIVWSGPSSSQVPVRHTEQVLCEVINYAKREIFIVSFVAYNIDTVIKSIRDAIGRNVQINILLESSIEHGGKVSQDSIKMMKLLFPSANIYTWSESNSSTEHPNGAIHAKCAIADSELAFITSANLTISAMERNIELGVLIKGGKIPGELNKHLNSLIRKQEFERIYY